MTEIPEHLLKRSQARKAASGDAAAAAAPATTPATTPAAGESAVPAVAAPKAPAVPAGPPPPKPDIPVVAAYKARRDRAVALLNTVRGMTCATPDGAFYVYPGCAGLIGLKRPDGRVLETDVDVALYFLEEAGVAVLDGSAYGLSPYLRLSIATSLEVIEEACQRLAHARNALQ